MPVPDQVQDDGSGIQNILKLLDSGVRRNDDPSHFQTFSETALGKSGPCGAARALVI